MSLGDAVAALFRGKPARKPLGMADPALQPPFETAYSDDLLFSQAKNNPWDSEREGFVRRNSSN
jgi:hypothetical protein